MFDLPSLCGIEPRIYGLGAWSDHVPFAFDLVSELRPKVIVELGTHQGESYFAFCQSALENGVDVRCYAVDTWQGDEQAHFYDESVYLAVEEHHRRHYDAFSHLMRSTFDQALPRFTDGTIDLLHIDGFHTYEAARHDFDAWLPKVSDGGIILMHDVCARQEGYGVWKVWEEICRHEQGVGRYFTFYHGWGLGVFRKGPRPEFNSVFLNTLLSGDGPKAEAMRRYYALNARFLKMCQNGGDPDLRAGYEVLRKDRANAQSIMEMQAGEIVRLQNEIATLTKAQEESNSLNVRLREERDALPTRRAVELQELLAQQAGELRGLREAIDATNTARESEQTVLRNRSLTTEKYLAESERRWQAELDAQRARQADEDARLSEALDALKAANAEQLALAKQREETLASLQAEVAELKMDAKWTRKSWWSFARD